MRQPKPLTADDYTDAEEAFWTRVKRTPDSCWEWQGGITSHGFGNVQIRGRQLRVHRLAHAFANGAIPERLLVIHSCDNRACCRPSHLRLGTHDDNMHDMSIRGRAVGWEYVPVRRGEANNKAKLTALQVGEIRSVRRKYAGTRAPKGERVVDLAVRYGVSIAAISKVARAETWRHVE